MSTLREYLSELARNRSAGLGVPETTGHPALKNLLEEAGANVRPRIRCVIHPGDRGAGQPDGGLFTEDQFPDASGSPRPGNIPSVAAIEVKPVGDDLSDLAESEQVARYLQRYNQVLITNYRQFVLLRQRPDGRVIRADEFSLAETPEEFWTLAASALRAEEIHGSRFDEFVRRVYLSRTQLTTPKDVAWVLASLARDALEETGKHELPTLATLRHALETALGVRFEGDKGDHFFHSSLVQTLFYGMFSGWVIWSRERAPNSRDTFDWRQAAWHLQVPMVSSLFQHIAQPNRVRELGLRTILDRAGEVLNRVDRRAFFATLSEVDAVQYFYEPFLESFDPVLRKDLGVWYTPPEVVQYMVTRVDRLLRSELGIRDGLADENVFILDPCCGTGAFLMEALRVIANTLSEGGGGATVASRVRQAARERVAGFEIMLAPFVVSHLQLTLMMQSLGAPFRPDQGDRPAVFLTNALTGWTDTPVHGVPDFPDMAAESTLANEIKRQAPILVVLGNPPYNAYAGTSTEEEGDLVEAYKEGLASTWNVRKYNLDELYVRFFRIAERRIVEGTGRGIVSFISNFSYLNRASFVVMRQHLLSGFDQIWIDCLNGDSRETGKLTPGGEPDPSVFSTETNREGIRLGTAIATMVRTRNESILPVAQIRSFWGPNKRGELLDIAGGHPGPEYEPLHPSTENQYSLRDTTPISEELAWPDLAQLSRLAPQNGLMEKRGGSLIDYDSATLQERIELYLDATLSWEQYGSRSEHLTSRMARFDPEATRRKVIAAESFREERIQQYSVRPFDIRFAYYCPIRPLWNEPRPNYAPHVWPGNSFLVSRKAAVASPEGLPVFPVSCLGDNDALRGHGYYFPYSLRASVLEGDTFFSEPVLGEVIANISDGAQRYLVQLGLAALGQAEKAHLIWDHALAVIASPEYQARFSGIYSRDWPSVPLPLDADALRASAARGRRISSLLDPLRDVVGVTSGAIDSSLRPMGALQTVSGRQIDPESDDLSVTASWGRRGGRGVTMPGPGRVEARRDGSLDVFLNSEVYWAQVPNDVWEYHIGGYQVIKKWLSYRESELLGRPLKLSEALHVTQSVRRLAALLAAGPELDENLSDLLGFEAYHGNWR